MNTTNKRLLFIGLDTIFWSIWLSRNDNVFNKKPISFYMQVLFRMTYWTRTWAPFKKEEGQVALQNACHLMKTMTMKIFEKHGWWSSNRLSF
jgi:hypothetical protein